MIDRRVARAVLLATIMIVSMAAPFVGGVAAADAPSGMVSVPSDQIGSDLPAQTPMGQQAQALAEGGVYASDHADTLEAIVTSPGRAKNKYSGGYVSGGGPLALVFADDVAHEGREVAVDADVLQEIMGFEPQLAYGAHDSGDEWRRTIEYRDGYAILEIPEFSSNTVTFSGEVNITATPASSGSEWSYDLDSTDSIESFSAEVTGEKNPRWDNVSQPLSDNGESFSVSVEGTKNAEGPSANDLPLVRIESAAPSTRYSTDTISPGYGIATNDTAVFVGTYSGNLKAYDKSDGSKLWEFTEPEQTREVLIDGSLLYVVDRFGEIYELDATTGTKNWNTSTGSTFISAAIDSSNIYVGTDGGDVEAFARSDQTQQWSVSPHSNSIEGISIDGSNLYTASQDNDVKSLSTTDGSVQWSNSDHTDHVFNVVTDGTYVYSGSYDNSVIAHDPADGSQQWSASTPENVSALALNGSDLFAGMKFGTVQMMDTGSGAINWSKDLQNGEYVRDLASESGDVYVAGDDDYYHKVVYQTVDPSVSIDGSQVVSHSGRLESGETVSSEYDLSTGDHTVEVAENGGAVDVVVEYQSVTQTVDPELDVNGYTTSYSGTLADGETTSLDVDPTWIEDGTNNVSVTVSETADGPTGQVELDYSHDAIDDQTVDYSGEIFSERYNFSRTWSAEQENAQVTIPFDGNVVEIRELTKAVDGGSATEVSSSDYTLENESLTVDLGTVAANETVELDLAASKVRPVNGEITVTEPTPLGSDLATEIRIDSKSSDFRVEVDPTTVGGNIHYTYAESWSNPQAYNRVHSDGTSAIYFPNAGAGSTSRIGTIPIELEPADNYVDARVQEAGSEPQFKFDDSSTASSVDVIWKDTSSGSVYELYSLSGDESLEKATAQSPVEFTVENPGGLEMIIYDLGSAATDVVGAGAAEDDGGLPIDLGQISIMIGSVIALGLLLWISSKVGDSRTSTIVVFLGGAVVILVAVQSFAPEVVAEILAGGISDAIPLIIVGLFGLAFLWLRGSGGSGDSIVLNVQGEK